MKTSDFHFDLPPGHIAQHPPAQRDAARMLTFDRKTGAVADRNFLDFSSLLRLGDVLVLNNSRVIPARLYATRSGLTTQANSPRPSGIIEVLLTQPLGNDRWRALVKPARKALIGERLTFAEETVSERSTNSLTPPLSATVVAIGERGERTLRFEPHPDFFDALDALGHVPLPPYMHRADTQDDRERYQTVYAAPDARGSAAAPTAGLHFTPAVLDDIRRRGVEVRYVTLHVGLGTFQPVHSDDLADIRLHEESYTLPANTADAINRAKAEGRRVVAVGTTTTRTLEHCAAVADSEPLQGHSGSTSIFLSPGHSFRVVDALLTNFHLPKSTLLMLVSAFASEPGSKTAVDTGRLRVLSAYSHAVASDYRFFSYGDCMFLS